MSPCRGVHCSVFHCVLQARQPPLNQPPPQIAWAKAGTKLRLLDIAPGKPSTMGKEITIKHNFVGTTNAASELRMVYKSDKDMQAKVTTEGSGVYAMGVISVGLHVTRQFFIAQDLLSGCQAYCCMCDKKQLPLHPVAYRRLAGCMQLGWGF